MNVKKIRYLSLLIMMVAIIPLSKVFAETEEDVSFSITVISKEVNGKVNEVPIPNLEFSLTEVHSWDTIDNYTELENGNEYNLITDKDGKATISSEDGFKKGTYLVHQVNSDPLHNTLVEDAVISVPVFISEELVTHVKMYPKITHEIDVDDTDEPEDPDTNKPPVPTHPDKPSKPNNPDKPTLAQLNEVRSTLMVVIGAIIIIIVISFKRTKEKQVENKNHTKEK